MPDSSAARAIVRTEDTDTPSRALRSAHTSIVTWAAPGVDLSQAGDPAIALGAIPAHPCHILVSNADSPARLALRPVPIHRPGFYLPAVFIGRWVDSPPPRQVSNGIRGFLYGCAEYFSDPVDIHRAVASQVLEDFSRQGYFLHRQAENQNLVFDRRRRPARKAPMERR